MSNAKGYELFLIRPLCCADPTERHGSQLSQLDSPPLSSITIAILPPPFTAQGLQFSLATFAVAGVDNRHSDVRIIVAWAVRIN